MKMGKWGLSTDLWLEMYENIIINVFWVTDNFFVLCMSKEMPGLAAYISLC